jgi:hypothetical protein
VPQLIGVCYRDTTDACTLLTRPRPHRIKLDHDLSDQQATP